MMRRLFTRARTTTSVVSAPAGARVANTALRAVSLAAVVTGLAVAVLVPCSVARAATLAPHVYAGGGVIGYGDAQSINPPIGAPLSSVMVAMASDPTSSASDQGYWLAAADGGVFAEGSARFYGSLGSLQLQGPIVAMAATPDGHGYWLAAMDGGVFSFGDAAFYGSMGGKPLDQPVVGMAATADGRGYWLVAADGGVFSFGDAVFHGSMGGIPLQAPVTGMAATSDGHGYWMVAADGGVFTFGNAPFFGSSGGQAVGDNIVGIAPSPHDRGYRLVLSNGGIFPYGDAPSYGSLAGGFGGVASDVPPVAAIALTPDAQGYWLLEPDGWSYGFSNPPSPPGSAAAIVTVANSQVNTDPDRGQYCNPYGPCEEWCALFTTWVWEQAGIPIPSYPFTGSIFSWASTHTGVLPPTAHPTAGDAVLYGTGPSSTATSLHTGVVVQTWPDGAIVTVEGDAGPGPSGSLAVVVNGPFMPSESAGINGMPIYAFAEY